jgi:hypothetical protein
MGMTPALRFRLHADARQAARRVVSVGVGPDGAVVALLADRPDGEARRPVHSSPEAVGALIIERTTARLVRFDAVPLAFPMAQPLPVGGLIVLGEPTEGGSDNAIVLDSDGRVVRTYHAGEAIEHALVDDHGCLWVSFSDEGVFSDDPISRAGLVRFEATTGRLLWPDPPGFAGDERSGLNVGGEHAWVTGSRAGVVRFGHDGPPMRWDVPDAAPDVHAFATDGDRLVGRDASDDGEWVSWRLGDGMLIGPERVVVAGLPQASRIDLIGRGAKLYAVAEGGVHVADMADGRPGQS